MTEESVPDDKPEVTPKPHLGVADQSLNQLIDLSLRLSEMQGAVKSLLEKTDGLKTDLKDTRTELKNDIGDAKAELKNDLKAVENTVQDLRDWKNQWFGGMKLFIWAAGIAIAMAGLLFTLYKTIGPTIPLK